PPVAVVVGPDGIGDHARLSQLFRTGERDVAEDAPAVVFQEEAPGRVAIPGGYDSSAYEQVDVSIAIEVGAGYDGAVREEVGQGIEVAREPAGAVVPVQAASQRFGIANGLIPAAYDEEIDIAIAVGIEEGGAHVFIEGVGCPQ